jgi:AcrR family transcriptional regulator
MVEIDAGSRAGHKPASSRSQQAKQTKQRIYDAAITLFKQKGFEYVTIDEIVHRAGTAKGTFYNYFQTKGDIIVEEFRDIDQFYERNRKRLEKFPTASEKLIEFTRSQCRYIKTRMGLETLKGLYANQVGFSATDPFVVNPKRKLSVIVADLIREGQKSGEFRSDISAEELTLWLNRCMRGMFFDWAVEDESYDLITHGVRFFENFILAGLKQKS